MTQKRKVPPDGSTSSGHSDSLAKFATKAAFSAWRVTLCARACPPGPKMTAAAPRAVARPRRSERIPLIGRTSERPYELHPSGSRLLRPEQLLADSGKLRVAIVGQVLTGADERQP